MTISDVSLCMDTLSAQVLEQIGTANDAMDDWRDILPDEVDKVTSEIKDRANAERAPSFDQRARCQTHKSR